MDEESINAYIEHLMEAVTDDPKVASVLLKWLDLKKRYTEVTADKKIELNMEGLLKHAEKSIKSDELEDKEILH